jgi:6-phosphogluconolactonase
MKLFRSGIRAPEGAPMVIGMPQRQGGFDAPHSNFPPPLVRVAEHRFLSFRNAFRLGSATLFAVALAACGGGGGGSSTSNNTTPPPPAKYTIGGSVSGLTGTGLVLQNNGGDNLAVSATGSFTFATSVSAGGSYAVTVMTQPSGQTCTVANGSGTANANVTNVTVSCAATTQNVTVGGTVAGLAGTGLVLMNNGGDALPVSANGSFTFVTSIVSGTVYAVTVSTQPSGPVQHCTVASGSGTASANVTSVAVTCRTTGKFLYTANHGDGTITAYSINPTTGVLTSNSGGVDIPDGTHPAAVSLAPNGKWAFSASDKGQKIHAFTIDQSTGALTEISGSPFDNSASFVVGHDYPDIAVDSQSKNLYLASEGDNLVVAFSINQTSGALTLISSYPAGTGAGGIPAFSPDGKYLYVMDQDQHSPTQAGDNSVSGYAVNADGSLTSLGAPVPTGDVNPTWISFRPDGKFAYVSNTNAGQLGSVTVFSVTNGVLAPVGSPVPTGGKGPSDLTIDATGTHLYAPNRNSSTISVFAIDPTLGTLTAVGAAPAGAGAGPILLVIDPTGRFAYAASSFGNDIWQYTIGTDGSLTQLGSAVPTGPTGCEPLFVNIDASGQFAYVSNSVGGTAGNGNGIAAFTLSQDTGELTAIGGSPFRSGLAPYAVSISPEAPGVRD